LFKGEKSPLSREAPELLQHRSGWTGWVKTPAFVNKYKKVMLSFFLVQVAALAEGQPEGTSRFDAQVISPAFAATVTCSMAGTYPLCTGAPPGSSRLTLHPYDPAGPETSSFIVSTPTRVSS
jgi:hypothetical protein